MLGLVTSHKVVIDSTIIIKKIAYNIWISQSELSIYFDHDDDPSSISTVSCMEDECLTTLLSGSQKHYLVGKWAKVGVLGAILQF